MIAFCGLLLLVSAKLVAGSDPPSDKPLVPSCEFGDVVQNECVKCVCALTQNVFQCSVQNCTKNATQRSPATELTEPHKPQCFANFAYILNAVTCLCTKNGTWPHPHCSSTFQALPPDNVTKEVCEPDSYVNIDCNVCRCGPDGKINKDRCTKNLCDKDKFVIKRRQGESGNTDSKCAPKNWYSFAPCQFCYCVNENKLVCNTGNRNEGKLLELGSYKLTVCGERLITDAEGLIPPAEKLLRDGNKEDILKNTLTTTNSADLMEKHIAADFTDSDERIMPNREGLSTQLPYEEDNDLEILTDESNENEMSIKVEDPKPSSVPMTTITTTTSTSQQNMDLYNLAQLVQQGQNMLRNNPNMANNQNNGQENVNFPQMLDKILSMALRKSMIKLEPGQECEPGSTKNMNCNICFCLVNGKLLCTDKQCT